MAKKIPPRKTPMPTWEQIASFYSGGNMRGPITFDWTNTDGTTGQAGSGQIRLNPRIKKSLDDFLKYGPKSQQGMVLGAQGLSTLIHEAIHNRDFAKGMPGSTEFFTPYLESDAVNPSTGFHGAGNEIQAHDLGWRLIPDMLQRFFGIPMDSAWGKKYTDMVMKTLTPPGG